jgi:hypothetical protein
LDKANFASIHQTRADFPVAPVLFPIVHGFADIKKKDYL